MRKRMRFATPPSGALCASARQAMTTVRSNFQVRILNAQQCRQLEKWGGRPPELSPLTIVRARPQRWGNIIFFGLIQLLRPDAGLCRAGSRHCFYGSRPQWIYRRLHGDGRHFHGEPRRLRNARQ